MSISIQSDARQVLLILFVRIQKAGGFFLEKRASLYIIIIIIIIIIIHYNIVSRFRMYVCMNE